MNTEKKKIPTAQIILLSDSGKFCHTALISHVPNHDFSYTAILKEEKKGGECKMWRIPVSTPPAQK